VACSMSLGCVIVPPIGLFEKSVLYILCNNASTHLS